MNLKPINQQVVVIVGATSGIGRAAAIEFADRGAKVVIGGRSSAAAEALAQDIQRSGGEAVPVTVDVSDFQQVKGLADRAVETYGRIDTWVQAAAVSLYAPFEETTPDEFKRVIEVNMLGQAYGAMAALPYLKREGRGALIHITSVEARQSIPLHSAYSASKKGTSGFLDTLRMELEHENIPISVTNIMPSSINTPFFSKSRSKLGVKPRPIPPVYDPQLVVNAILHAAEHPVRELVVGGSGKTVTLLHRISPKAANAALQKTGYVLQFTNEPKSVDAPDNLFEHIYGYDTVKGEFGEEEVSVSPVTSLQMRPALRWGLMAAFALAAGAFALRPIWQEQRLKRMSFFERIRYRLKAMG